MPVDYQSPAIIENPPRPLWRNKLLLAIVLLGAVLRGAFLLVGARLYYGPEHMYTNGDSDSYIMSFRNLVERGVYNFDLLEPQAAFGRLPGFPFFYGLHYYLFGVKDAIVATACSQAVLDTVSIVLLFMIVARLATTATAWAPYVAALLYAVYPFTIVWTTIMGTETLATFLVLVWLNTLLAARYRWVSYALLGIEIAVIFYVRDFLGLLLPVTCLYLLLRRSEGWRPALRQCVLVTVGFGALYIWWPVRNYVFQHQLVLVKPVRAGFANYKEDMTGYLDWIHSWTNESTYWLRHALSNPNPPFPAEVFASAREQAHAQALVAQAVDCGSSFYLYKHNGSAPPPGKHDIRESSDYLVECNADIHAGFEQLRDSYRQHHPVAYYTHVPLLNLFKALFKSGKQDTAGVSRYSLAPTVLFGYRSLLLLLGIGGLLYYRRQPGLWPITLLWLPLLLYLCGIYRQLEIRYLLQTDVLLLVPASLLLGHLLTSWLASHSRKLVAITLNPLRT